MDWCGLLVDYCDVFINCLDCHSDGTHSLQRIHWWASDVLLHFSKSVLMKNQTHLHGLRVSTFSANFHFLDFYIAHPTLDGTQNLINSILSLAIFPSSCFYAHFEVSHQKWVNKSPKGNKSFNSQKKFSRSLEVGFDLCEKRLMWRMGDMQNISV